MTDILMVEVEDATGNKWNLNLNYVLGVEIPPPGPINPSTKITNEMLTLTDGRVIQLPPGTWHTAIADLIAEFNTGTRKAEDHLFIGGAP